MKQKTVQKDNILSLIKSKYIRNFLKKYWLSYVFGIVFLITIDFLQTRIPVIIGVVIDGLDQSSINSQTILNEILRIGILALGIVAGRVLWRYFIFGTARKIERDIRNDLFSQLEKMSLEFFHQHKTGEIMAYITNDLEAVRQAMGQGVMMIFDVFCLLAFIISDMIKDISFTLTMSAVIPLLIIALVTGLLGPRLFKKFSERQEAFAKVSDFVQEDISGMKVIKAFVQQEKEIQAFDKVNQEYFAKNISLSKTRSIMDPLMTLISGLSFAIAIAYGGILALNGSITVGNFSVFISYLGMLVWPMMAVGMSLNMITMGSASLKRIETILSVSPEIHDNEPVSEVADFNGEIEVKNLTYRYPSSDNYVLKDVSFKVESGQTLGIVGRTGSGKTTLMNLLVRLYDAEAGSIFVSGVDVLDLPLKQLRGNIGYVTQDNFLFSDTIANNIDYVDGNSSQEKIQAAAEFSCVHDNIIDFAEGYNTLVGEKGVTLSGGQKQRISISRAYIIEPQILILDDSVSAVDTDTEEKILTNIKNLRKGKTNVIIAHRLSALIDADQIIVIDNGAVTEQGTHKQLLARKGLYFSLYKKQQLEKMIDEEE